MAQEAKVVAAMKEADYYREGSSDDLKVQYMEEQTIKLGGKDYTLSRISYLDAKIFSLELDSILNNENPLIHEIYAKYATNIFDLVRMVNVNSKQGFKGMMASGNELDLLVFSPRQFYDPDNSGNARTSWVRTISSTGSKNLFEGTTTGAELTMAEEQGMIFLALYNPAMDPCIDSIKVSMNTEPFNVQTLDFNQVQVEMGDPIIELKEPWTLPPEQSGEIEAYYFQTGTDETRFLGVEVAMAKNLRDLTDLLHP